MLLLAALLAAAPQASDGAAARPKVRASASIPNFVAQRDYPVEALRRREQGTVVYRIDVDATGAVAGCTIAKSSGSRSLDQGTCDLFRRRAHFRPARDADGHPVPDSVGGEMRWRLPG